MTSEGAEATAEWDRETFVPLVRELTRVESPSDDAAALDRCAQTLAGLVERVVGVRATLPRLRDDGPPVVRVDCGGGADAGGVLLLGHLDTVWPLGTLERRPFAVEDGRMTGPGVFDMKAGLAQALVAMRRTGCRTDGGPAVTLLVTYDEEIGSPEGRPLVEEAARDAQAVLVLEPAGPGGAPKAARKGWARYEVVVSGRAAHVGLDPDAGRNALLEMARVIEEVDGLDQARAGLRVIPTTARAGHSANTIPEQARLTLDVRATRHADLEWLEGRLRAIVGKPGRACALELAGGVNRPPMERDTAADLAARVERCADRLRLAVPDPVAVGGVSDGNFTAALRVPTLDGLGAVGGGAHAEHEWADLAAMPQQTRLLAALVQDLADEPLK